MSDTLACLICGEDALERVVELPALPLTGRFSRHPGGKKLSPVFDQALLVCGRCGHGQLAKQLSPEILYGYEYSFRTAASQTSSAGTRRFLEFLDGLAGDRRFRCVLDLGCNDLHLLQMLGSRAALRVGIDPIWAGREDERSDKSIIAIGETLEGADLQRRLPERPDLIVCRHTLEHMGKPVDVMCQLFEFAADGALLLFESPGFEALVRRFRFDQVFHEHLQYFTPTSFRTLGRRVNARFVAGDENYHHWGALLAAFAKAGGAEPQSVSQAMYTPAEIKRRFIAFKRDMLRTRELLDGFRDGPLYGYGAAQMLPIIAYHMETDLSMLDAVLDDDPAKQGLYYENLPLEIRAPSVVRDMEQASVFISAPDNVKLILARLLTGTRPRHILSPLQVI